MALIKLTDASVQIPIYNARSRSLKNRIFKIATGGKLGSDQKGNVYVDALKNLNLEIKNGDRLGIIGHNGAGKTTLLRVLSGAYHPTNGDVLLEGKSASLIQISLGINPEATGRENIFLRGAMLGLGKKKLMSKFKEIIDFCDLGDFIDMPVRTYSTGMQLRLAFAVSTSIAPDILLMDEWLSVGDKEFSIKAEQRLITLLESTKILVIASHSRDLIEKTCNRLIWMENGEIKMDGNPMNICQYYFDQ